MKFTKMQGAGNDYIYIDCTKESIEDPGELSVRLSDRHFGIGGDGIILIKPSDKADFMMDIYNADGSRAKMCGNGIRCVAKFVYDHLLTDKEVINIDTLSGVKKITLRKDGDDVVGATVDMGVPVLEASKIPVKVGGSVVVGREAAFGGMPMKMTCVSMGNPHAVFFVKDVEGMDISGIGPAIEGADIFPEGVNAEFVEVVDNAHIKMRVWERGSQETLACGTGACASVVAASLNGFTGRKALVELIGGDLLIDWSADDDHVYMTGPAQTVFEGEILIK